MFYEEHFTHKKNDSPLHNENYIVHTQSIFTPRRTLPLWPNSKCLPNGHTVGYVGCRRRVIVPCVVHFCRENWVVCDTVSSFFRLRKYRSENSRYDKLRFDVGLYDKL